MELSIIYKYETQLAMPVELYCNIYTLYYSKFAKDQLFDIAYFSPIANDTPVQGPHYCVFKLSICHVQLALIIFNSFKSILYLLQLHKSNTL